MEKEISFKLKISEFWVRLVLLIGLSTLGVYIMGLMFTLYDGPTPFNSAVLFFCVAVMITNLCLFIAWMGDESKKKRYR